MTTFIVALAVLGILGMLGAALAFSWLCGQAAGRAVQWAMGAPPHPADADALTPQELQDIDALIHRARKNAGLPPLH